MLQPRIQKESTRIGETQRLPSEAELREWLERMSAGDPHGLELIFNGMYAPLCAFAETFVHSAATAEDIVGDMFLKVWTHRDRIHVRGSVRNYLYMAVRNSALNQIHRARRTARFVEAYPAEGELPSVSTRNEAEDRLQFEALADRVSEAIEQLPRRAQQTYLLYYQHDMSYAEIGRVMDVSVKTVENQLARALRLLWAQVGDLFT